jgi:SAM-dependent methyltransferase
MSISNNTRLGRMSLFEWSYMCAEPFMLPLYGQVRARLVNLVREQGGRARILDVGGRKSHYTVAVPSDVCITDLPRRSALQQQLHLGITDGIIDETLARRTNVRWIVFDDMTKSSMTSNSFDMVVAVEVLEHVERDADFVSEVARVLKPNGVFLMTTPNGDFLENTNPDHKRHYTGEQLRHVLKGSFEDVAVEFAVLAGRLHQWGLASWSPNHPWRTARGMLSNWINSRLSSRRDVASRSVGTCHLIAAARIPMTAPRPE